jgi:hypothetical protein
MHVNVLEIKPNAEFGTYRPPAVPEDDSLVGRLLVRISNTARLEDHFKVVLGGAQNIQANFAGPDLNLHPQIQRFRFRLEMNPAAIDLKANCFSGKWEDLEDLVAAEKILVSTEEQADASAQFRAECEACKNTENKIAASLRWAVQANQAYGFRVVLQTLPATARSLRRDARLVADTAQAVEVASWTAVSPMATEGMWSGPVPILFAADSAAARANLVAHTDRLATGTEKFTTTFSTRP